MRALFDVIVIADHADKISIAPVIEAGHKPFTLLVILISPDSFALINLYCREILESFWAEWST